MPDLSGPPGHRRNAARSAAIRKSREGGSGMKVKDVSIRLRARKICNALDYIIAEHPALPDSVLDLLHRANENAEQIVDLCEGNDVDV